MYFSMKISCTCAKLDEATNRARRSVSARPGPSQNRARGSDLERPATPLWLSHANLASTATPLWQSVPLSIQSERLDLANERAERNAQALGRARLIAAGLVERRFDELRLEAL